MPEGKMAAERLKVIQRHIFPGCSPRNGREEAGQRGGGGAVGLFPAKGRGGEGSGQDVPREQSPIPHTKSPQGRNSVIPKKRQELLKWNGWGYRDSHFYYRNNEVGFAGNRYPLGNFMLPFFTKWIRDTMGIDFTFECPPQPPLRPEEYPDPILNKSFMQDLVDLGLSHSLEGEDRLFRGHGHTLRDIYILRQSRFARIPDVVVWPDNHDAVVKVVESACKHNVVLIPFGGGTSVSGALECPPEETRMIVSLDMSQMDRILWIDEENLTANVEAGVIGQDLERQLQQRGYTTGHEPDSYEFSSVGGWVATRASGMKKNTYGNIEDLVVHARMVSPQGVLEKGCEVPRLSCGPDLHHMLLGSEGTLGVITQVTLKIRPLPPCKKYGSVAFPDFESGLACMREVARQRCQPSSIRLVDNEQFKFSQALRPAPGPLGLVWDGLKKMYITRLKGFDINQMCAATLVFEGTTQEVALQEKRVYSIAESFGGIPAGEVNGKRGYMLTFVIAYIRDLALDFAAYGESFETSVPWSRTLSLCKNVKYRVAQECKDRGIVHFLMSCRVTQTYDSGSCVYFYFAFNGRDVADPLATYEEIESAARDEILASGGSISHHHGVGKIRKRWLPHTLSPSGLDALRALKQHLDPQNIFGNGNLMQ